MPTPNARSEIRSFEPAATGRYPACRSCGAPARSCVLEGYRAGEPVLSSYCLGCVEHRPRVGVIPAARPRTPLGAGALLIVAGLIVGAGVASVDWLGPTAERGLGGLQLIGICGGALFVLFGALLTIDVLALTGTILVGVAALADFLGLGGSPGIGWKQEIALILAAVLIVAGTFGRRTAVRRFSRRR